jgi:hypothetical protein
MKKALILPGTCDESEYFNSDFPSLSNSHWFPWLQKELLIKGIFTQALEMPDAYNPDYDKWKNEFEKFGIDENTILIGHSCGGGFLLRWLTENKIKIDKLILVAPWLDPNREKTIDFFNFSIDPQIQEITKEIHIFVSTNDETDILQSIETIKKALPQAQLHEFKNMGHFTYEDMGKKEFPELLNIIQSQIV